MQPFIGIPIMHRTLRRSSCLLSKAFHKVHYFICSRLALRISLDNLELTLEEPKAAVAGAEPGVGAATVAGAGTGGISLTTQYPIPIQEYQIVLLFGCDFGKLFTQYLGRLAKEQIHGIKLGCSLLDEYCGQQGSFPLRRLSVEIRFSASRVAFVIAHGALTSLLFIAARRM